MLNILTITGPIYIAIGLGYSATRRGFFSKADIQALGRFVMYFALPAMLFNALAQRHFEDVLHAGFLWAYGLGRSLPLCRRSPFGALCVTKV